MAQELGRVAGAGQARKVIVLDTHVLIWAVENHPSLLKSTAAEIDSNGLNDAVVVSAVSFWEIGSLVQKGRLRLSLPFREWVERTLSRPGFVATDLTIDIAVESTTLPRGIHPDPADRFLIATARMLDAILVTHDRRILNYGAEGHVKVLAA